MEHLAKCVALFCQNIYCNKMKTNFCAFQGGWNIIA